MKVLVACEESQAVTIAFRKRGHVAYSCDIEECSGGHPEWHFQRDVIPLLKYNWDLVIAHPPCTYLSNAGMRWFNEEKYGEKARERKRLRIEAFLFIMKIKYFTTHVKRVCIENPIGWINTQWRKQDQIIYPYQFGDPESKRTCLWLKGLPKLKHTKIVEAKIYGYFKNGKQKGKPIYYHSYISQHPDRQKLRSKTFPGIARAMAEQWGKL